MFTLQLLFVFYYFGHILTMQLLNLCDLIYLSEWYLYPLNVQRCVTLILLRSQKPFYISGYGIMACNLENFLGVSIQQFDEVTSFLNRKLIYFQGTQIGIFCLHGFAKH